MEGLRVETADGRLLGHVFELRCRWRDSASVPVIDSIIFGQIGFLQRVGFRRLRPRSVPWRKVQAIRGDVIVLAPSSR
jgi:sporulation protein YlmC with PRC-barrel domain